MLNKGEEKIIYHAIEGIDELRYYGDSVESTELHNKLFNEDYFIIGRYEAERFLQDCGGIFQAIELITDWEKSEYGEVSTNLSEAESVANTYAYIRGIQFLLKCPTFARAYDRWLSVENLQEIKEELLELV